jgi:hypothetical protein
VTQEIGGQYLYVFADTEPPPGGWPLPLSRLECLAVSWGLSADEFRGHLRAEIQRRLREKAARHALAYSHLDAKLERNGNGKGPGG